MEASLVLLVVLVLLATKFPQGTRKLYDVSKWNNLNAYKLCTDDEVIPRTTTAPTKIYMIYNLISNSWWTGNRSLLTLIWLTLNNDRKLIFFCVKQTNYRKYWVNCVYVPYSFVFICFLLQSWIKIIIKKINWIFHTRKFDSF